MPVQKSDASTPVSRPGTPQGGEEVKGQRPEEAWLITRAEDKVSQNKVPVPPSPVDIVGRKALLPSNPTQAWFVQHVERQQASMEAAKRVQEAATPKSMGRQMIAKLPDLMTGAAVVGSKALEAGGNAVNKGIDYLTKK